MEDIITGISTTETGAESRSLSRTLIGVVAALMVTAGLLGGYALLRQRHGQQVEAAKLAAAVPAPLPKGSPKAQIFVDEAMLKGDQTIVGGTVRNVSAGDLQNLSVKLELKRRKDGTAELASVPVTPQDLKPEQEGRYSLQLHSAHYSMVKLVSLQSGNDSALVVFTSLPGQKRPPEKIQGRTVVGGRSGSPDGFLNSPDNPMRVP